MKRREFLKLSAAAFVGSLIPFPKTLPDPGGYLVPEEFARAILKGARRSGAMILDNLGIRVNLPKAYASWSEAVGKGPEDLTRTERQQALLHELLSDTSTTD